MADGYGLRDSSRAEDRKLADTIRAELLPHQLNVIEDRSRNKAVLCPRRAGKSYTAMAYAFDTCLRKVNARVVIVNLTLRNAKDVYWYEMNAFANKFGITCRFYQNELRTVLPNGSQILLTSADSRQEIEKLRGGQYDLVIIDECKSYAAHLLHELIYEVVKPALADRSGTIMMIGTPGNIMKGPFFEATYPGYVSEQELAKAKKSGKTPKPVSRDFTNPEPYWIEHPKDYRFWSRHHWSTRENTKKPQIWDDFVKTKADAGWSDDEPIWRREALGEWINTGDAFVYAYANLVSTDFDRVTWIPDYEKGNQHGLATDVEWRYLLGLDLGYEDAYAMVVVAYNPYDGKLYHVWDYKESHLDVYEVVDTIEKAIDRFGRFDAIVADCGALGKMIIETINRRHGLNIKKAEKTEKLDHQELLNADFRAGRMLIQPGSDLAIELSQLQFDLSKGTKEQLARAGKLKEAPNLPNDLCDALLYIWRYSYHYYSETRPSLVQPGTAEWYQERESRAMANAVAARNALALRPAWAEWSANKDPLKDFYGN